jgi:hypothetical protein
MQSTPLHDSASGPTLTPGLSHAHKGPKLPDHEFHTSVSQPKGRDRFTTGLSNGGRMAKLVIMDYKIVSFLP